MLELVVVFMGPGMVQASPMESKPVRRSRSVRNLTGSIVGNCRFATGRLLPWVLIIYTVHSDSRNPTLVSSANLE